jgi:hypothetical protein
MTQAIPSWNPTPVKDRIINFVTALIDRASPDYVPRHKRVAVFDNDGPGKPLQIWNIIGRCPILAAGNSNGDLQMLNFAGGSSLPALRLLVVHDDQQREFNYQAGAEQVLEAADRNDWTAISIKEDWNNVFPV